MAKAGKIKDTVRKPAKRPPVAKQSIRESIGVRNPYAVAEAAVKRRIPWQKWTRRDRKLILEGVFGRPRKEIFGPKTGGLDCPCTPSSDKCCPQPNWKTLTTWKFRDISYGLDPVQGVTCNCYFVAALSSVAWSCRSQIKENLTGDQYKISLYNESTSKWIDMLNTKSLPLDSSDNFRYTRSSTPNEVWPSYYEKAFVGFLSNPGAATPSTVDTPSMNTLCACGNPLPALTIITGWTVKMSGFTRDKKYVKPDCSDLWTDIKGLTSGFKAKYPVVAWSFKDKAAANLDTSKWPDFGVDTIAPNHSYSLLGVYTNNSINYVVLRNPFGPDAGDPDDPGLAGSLGTGTWTYNDTHYARGGTIDIPGTSKSINLGDTTDGVFALSACAFKSYFEGWAWVK
jgi:hypothetical protein